jgi:hypothetical protein
MAHKAWDVFSPPRKGEKPILIDTVFFDSTCDKDYVLDSLINHDGYRHDIVVKPAK